MSQKITTRIYEENEQVEILSCTYNNQSYEVQILPVIIDFQLSIALHFHQTDNVQSLTYDKKTTKAQIDRSHFNFSMPANNTNVGGYGTPVNVKRESFSRAAAVNMKRINFNGLPMLQNLSNQNTPVLNPQMHSTNNFQFIGDEKEEEILQIISFYQGMIKLFNSGVDDLIATLEYTCSQMQMKLIQLQIQGLKHLKQEQKLLFDALCLKATFFKNQYSSPNAMISNGIYGNQQTGLSNPPVQYHYFEFSEIQAAIKHHLFIHGYDYYFNVKAVMPQQYQIFSNKEAIQSMIQSCIYLIVELTKLKSMHQQQQNLMRTFSNSGAPIPQSTIQQNVNNIINGLNNPLTSTNTQTMQFSHHTHKMINIEFTQIISTNAASNINVKISNIQHPNLLDQQKHSKLSSFFFNVLRTYLDKVGIPASLQYKQNNDNLRYQLTFTLLSDCNSLQIQQQQLTSQYLIQANMATNRQTLAVAENNNNNNNNTLSVYNNSNNVNISSNNNAITLKDKTLNNPTNGSSKNTSSSNNNNNNNGEVDQGELANQDKDKEQGLNNKVPSVNLFVKIKNQNNNNVVIEEQANGYDEPNSNNEQFDLNLYNNIDVEGLEEESDRLEVDNEYQQDDYKLNKQEKTGIGSGALFLVDSSIQTANKLDANHQTKNQTLFSKTAFGPKRNLSLQYN